MTKQELINEIKRKKSFLCVGLDVDLDKIPPHLLQEEDPIFAFNKKIIDQTHDLAVAYKPNTAFYESYGLTGWKSLEKTIDYLNKNYPEIFTIADAKRGDIGNTSSRYAKAFFDNLSFDSVTVAPYMGKDSVEPFLEFEGKHTILLAHTSNEGGKDFQTNTLTENNNTLYEKVIETSLSWKNNEQLMYVVGATKAQSLERIRKIIPNHFLLVPGVGAQGGDLEEVCAYGLNKDIGLLINSSRGIIYADQTENFSQISRQKALEIQNEMEIILKRNQLL